MTLYTNYNCLASKPFISISMVYCLRFHEAIIMVHHRGPYMAIIIVQDRAPMEPLKWSTIELPI
jgi:hypothetical protein